ncbi:MAG: cadmium-translocating P-type ATPase [Syntrophomonadaceae bacterium]|jgi:Cd2+/Zn2+-exporting ATPase|nr:cadmium-translocating P-type ATPase [Syntrophomonadaceae bacterium]
MNQAVLIKKSLCSGSYQVNGLDCPDCAAKVEKAVKMLPGIATVDLSFPSGRMNIDYDPLLAESMQVINKVRVLGYDAEEIASPADNNKATVFRLQGLDCADCAAKLEKSVTRVPGVDQAQVNFAASKMTVKHQGSTAEIISVIEKMGYSGEVDQPAIHQQTVSFWKTNQYIIPTLISFIMLAAGVIAGITQAPALLSTIFFITGIILGGFLPFKNGISVLINAREFDMNILMAIAVIGAAVIGEYVEAAAVVFLFSLGNALQGYTLDKTRNSIRALMELAPDEALVKRSGREMTLPVAEIDLGDIIIIRPGEKIAMDGQVIKGFSAVNQAPITGESIPVEKNAGDEVYAGTVNEHGALEIKVTKLAKDNTISRIIEMVEEAQGQKAPSQQFVDKFAKYYTPLVILGAALVAVVPPLLFDQPFHKWFYEAMAMLLVACPCALVISTPVSIVSAIGSAARNGVLIKGGAYLEEAGALSVVAFDKTGTLTQGKPQVTDVIPLNGGSSAKILQIAAAIESRSEHPLGEAIVNHTRGKNLIIPAVSEFTAIPGKGARAKVGDIIYQIGNTRLFDADILSKAQIEDTVSALQSEGKTVMILGNDHEISGLIAVADVLRHNSRQALAGLKKAGIKHTVMLTGDNCHTAQAIAAKAGVDEFKSDLLPEDKVMAMKDLSARYGKTAMVGDGVNDAPAMAISTVGIAMGAAGTDAALETADIALMADDLTKLAYVIKLSRRTLSIIKQNIAFALIIKGFILLLVIPGWLTLWLAVVGDMGSTLLVTLNSMRLLRVKN